MTERKRPAKKKAAAKKPAAKRPAKKRAANSAAAKKQEAQERALTWATTYSSPLIVLDGWDPKTGKWSSKSPIGQMIKRMEKGGHLQTAGRRYGIERPDRLVERGRDILNDQTISEDRDLIPIDVLPFVDLVRAIDAVEADVELDAVEAIYDKIKADPRLGLTFLARRFPARWREQQEIMSTVEYDPRDQAITEMLNDPNTAMEMARYAREASRRAAELDVEE